MAFSCYVCESAIFWICKSGLQLDLSRLPPLTSLRAFEAAARHGSLSAAARELNVTHPAVAQQVRRLEQWLDTPLLARSGRGVATTVEGALLAEGLSSGFGALAQAVERLSATRTDRPLRLTTTPSFAAGWLVPRIAGFRSTNPGFELMINPTPDVIDLVADDYDLAVRYGSGDWPGLEAMRVVESNVVVVASPALVAASAIKTPADLCTLPWIQEFGTDEVRVWLASHGVETSALPSLINLPGNLATDAVRAGQGAGLMARTWVADDIDEGRLVTLFEEEQDPALGYYVVHKPGPHRPILKSFLAWIWQECCT
ncbi:MAG: LysR substrate-binding domain-containing protein [Pseudomonadota bacterium]